jgi:hypothetical protein
MAAHARTGMAIGNTMRMVRDHGRRIHSIAPRLGAIFTVSIALWRRQRMLIVIWAVGGTSKRRASAFLSHRAPLRGDGGGRGSEGDLGRCEEREFLEKRVGVRHKRQVKKHK